MGTPVYVLITSVAGASFVKDAKGIPSVRYVSTAAGAYRGVVVLDLAKPTDLDAAVEALVNCGASRDGMQTLRPVGKGPFQLKWAPPDQRAAFVAVKVNNVGQVTALRDKIRAVPGVNAAEIVAGDTDILVEVQGNPDQVVHTAVQAVLGVVGDQGRTRTSFVANKWWRGPPEGKTPA